MCSSCLMVAGKAWRNWAGMVLAIVIMAGCAPKRPVETFPPATSRDAIQRARDLLELYAGGQPVGSESIGFDVLVEDVRKVDAATAATLERGLAEITARPAAARATAARLLKELPVSAAAAAAAAGVGPTP